MTRDPRHPRLLPAILFVCCGLAIVNAPSAAARDNPLAEALKAKYTLTKTGWDRERITQPGIVLVIEKGGISADLSKDLSYLDNKVVDGQISQKGGFVAAMQDKKTSRELKTGDKVFVYNIEIKNNIVDFFLLTCDTFDENVHGSTQQTRYKALVSFEFPAGALDSATVDSVEKVVNQVIIPESEAQAANTKTVELGQTTDQVKSALGAPDKIIKLGPKEVYVYKDMKVVFVDGKVSDVQ